MPLYDYVCAACSHEFEQFSTIADRDKIVICSKCDSESAKRKISAGSISYKGAYSAHQRAGDGWKEVQQKIKAGSGRVNTIRTK